MADAWAPIPNELLRDGGWSKAEALVYVALLCMPYTDRGMIRASQTELAAGAGIAIRTVRKVIPTLCARGAISYGQPYDGVKAYYYVKELPRESGFFKLPRTWLWDVQISSAAKIIYLVLMAHRNKRTGIAFTSWAVIGSRARVTKRSIGPALTELHDAGLIVRQHQKREGRREGVNLYHLPDPMRAEAGV